MKHRAAARLCLQTESGRVRIESNKEHVEELCLSLTLLMFDLVNTIQLFDPTVSLETRLEIRKANIEQMFSSLLWRTEQRPVLHLSSRDIRVVLTFLLQYYRDSYGNVDHVDLSVDVVGGSRDRIDVTIAVSESAPPVSEDEARRRLGL